MKKIFFILAAFVCLSGFYAGDMHESGKGNEGFGNAAGTSPDTGKMERVNGKPPDATLNHLGESVVIDKGKVMLEARNPLYEAFFLGGMEYIVNDVKLLKFEPSSQSDSLTPFCKNGEVHYIKLDVELTNQNAFPVYFDPVKTIKADGADLQTEIFREGLSGMIGAGETKSGRIGFLVEDAGKDAVALEVQSSRARSLEDEKISEAAQFDVVLNRQP